MSECEWVSESERESEVTWPIMVTHISALHLTHPKCTCTHAYREHTPGAVGSHLCCGARGAVGGLVPCSRASQSWYWGWREHWTFTPPTYNFCRTWDCVFVYIWNQSIQPPGQLQDILLQRTKLSKQFNKGISTLSDKLF